ncbi:MAG TPA: DUF805 domain-containing protein [Rhizomicrobium sp.]|nr:DUF805 domain-containing protein [Rhizomicrobium sp.]
MDWGNFLFGFDGRINRAKAWLWILISIIVYAVFGFGILKMVFGVSLITIMMEIGTRPADILTTPQIPLAAFCVFYVLMIFIGCAVATKRLHDRNKGAIWLIPFILLPLVLNLGGAILMPPDMSSGVPAPNPVKIVLSLISFALSLWAFVELYCLRGTEGENPYGPDPLARKPH